MKLGPEALLAGATGSSPFRAPICWAATAAGGAWPGLAGAAAFGDQARSGWPLEVKRDYSSAPLEPRRVLAFLVGLAGVFRVADRERPDRVLLDRVRDLTLRRRFEFRLGRSAKSRTPGFGRGGLSSAASRFFAPALPGRRGFAPDLDEPGPGGGGLYLAVGIVPTARDPKMAGGAGKLPSAFQPGGARRTRRTARPRPVIRVGLIRTSGKRGSREQGAPRPGARGGAAPPRNRARESRQGGGARSGGRKPGPGFCSEPARCDPDRTGRGERGGAVGSSGRTTRWRVWSQVGVDAPRL